MPPHESTHMAKQRAYLALLENARQLNDRGLVRLVLKKLNQLSPTPPTGAFDRNCAVITFPLTPSQRLPLEPESASWWMLIKLTLAVPGSVTALFLLSVYAM